MAVVRLRPRASRYWAGLAAVLVIAAASAAHAELSGEELYQTYCASCHGLSATGDGPLAELLVRRPADLTKLADKYGLILAREKLVQFIDGRLEVKSHGPREMPVWGERFALEPPPGASTSEDSIRQTIEAIVNYLISIQKVQGA